MSYEIVENLTMQTFRGHNETMQTFACGAAVKRFTVSPI
jgi:hypothetical protein